MAIFDELNPQGKDNVYYGGLKEYKSQIETTKQQYFAGFGEKVNKNSFLEGFKNLLPIDRLDNLTQISKKQLTENAVAYVGNPGEGRATLYWWYASYLLQAKLLKYFLKNLLYKNSRIIDIHNTY